MNELEQLKRFRLKDMPGSAGLVRVGGPGDAPGGPGDAPGGPEDGTSGPAARTRGIVTVLFVALIALLVFCLAPHFSSPEAHTEVIATIEEKIDNVLTLTAGSAGASALISAIPGDAGSPIANKLMDLSTGFLIVLAALYLEKYLITIFSGAALGIVLPLAIVCFIGAVWAYGRSRWCGVALQLGFKLATLGAVLLLVIPTSAWVTNKIDATYEQTLQESVEKAEQLSEGAAKIEEDAGEKGGEGFIEAAVGFFTGLFDTVSKGLGGAIDGAKEALSQFIESLAIMLVTSCLIPILVLFLYLWVIKILLGVNIDLSATASALNPSRVRSRLKDAANGADRS